ncbi:MAG: sigma-54 dependent transcriptional regulator [Planctomycetota bacterium]
MSANSAHRILVVDDEAFVLESLAEVLASAGYQVESRGAAAAALEALEKLDIDVVLSDFRMPGLDGIRMIEEARRRGIEVPVIVMTGVGTVERAVEAMKAGAFDFLEKPVEPEQLLRLVRHALERRSLLTEIGQLRAAVKDLRGAKRLAGESAAIRAVRAAIERVAPTEATVLVRGESGTGKELVAEAIHDASPRAGGNLVRVNCAAIPDGLFESEFFGHRRGAFSGAVADRVGRFEEARGGTLVLDEVGTLRADGQAKLLRVLEGGEFQVVGESSTRRADCRVVAVTNEDLRARVNEGVFRGDLYYRLDIFPIEVPPLRDRREDVGPIAEELLARIAARHALPAPRAPLDDAAIAALASYPWPGNVRELRNVLERALIVTGGATPDAETLRGLFESGLVAASVASDLGGDLHLRRRTDQLEVQLIEEALARSGDVKKDAAEMLGIDPRNLGYYLRKHGLAGRDAKDGG